MVEFIDEAGRTLKEAPFFINTFRARQTGVGSLMPTGTRLATSCSRWQTRLMSLLRHRRAETLGEVYAALETYLSNGVGVVRSEEYLGRDTYGKVRTMHLISLMKA